MKFSIAFIATILGVSQAFSVVPSTTTITASSSTALAAMDRRAVLKGVAAAAAVAAPLPAFAGEYVPKVDDLKQIYFLGVSLDKLKDKLSNPDTVEAALDGVRLFNKDPNFYPGYAKNFILKTVKKSADADPRVGYIKQVGHVCGVAANGTVFVVDVFGRTCLSHLPPGIMLLVLF